MRNRGGVAVTPSENKQSPEFPAETMLEGASRPRKLGSLGTMSARLRNLLVLVAAAALALVTWLVFMPAAITAAE